MLIKNKEERNENVANVIVNTQTTNTYYNIY